MTNSLSISHTLRFVVAIICTAALACALMPIEAVRTQAYAADSDLQRLEQDAAGSSADEGFDAAEPSSDSAAEPTPEEALEADHVPGELLVVYEGDLPSVDEELVLDDGGSITLEGASVVDQDFIGDMPDDKKAAVVTLEDGSAEAMAEAIETLSSVEEVAFVEPNYTYTASNTVPNDEYAKSAYQYYLELAGITSMWDSAKAEGNVAVAVIDSGCNLNHPDFEHTVNKTYAYDVVSKRPLSLAGVANNGDSYGHGTNVCGVLAAEANNTIGTAGTSWNASIVPVRIFTDTRDTDSKKLAAALEYVDSLIENRYVANLRVVNMSLGGDGNSDIVQTWIDHLYKAHGVLSVAAGGNGDRNGKPITTYTYPSDYNSCIGVTSTKSNGANSTWCDYNDAKDIAAPGEMIWTTTLNGSWGNYEAGYGNYVSGTSFSAPLVAGAAAAMFAKYPSASAYDVVEAMQATAKAVSGQPSASGSAGMLNAGSAQAYLASHITGKNPANGLGTVVDYAAQGIPMYRLYNRVTSEHFYTASAYERDVLRRGDWNYEGVGWTAPKSGSPVYRLYNPGLGDHHYTPNYSEAYSLVAYNGWNYEGIGWFSGGTIPLYRQYNPGLRVGQHNYTTNAYERDQLIKYHGWRNEGVGWYALK